MWGLILLTLVDFGLFETIIYYRAYMKINKFTLPEKNSIEKKNGVLLKTKQNKTKKLRKKQ